MSELINITTEKLTLDHKTFKEKLNLTAAGSEPRYEEMQALIEGELALSNIKNDPARIDKFYSLYAEYTEKSNPIKFLYQVLLEEYLHLGVFSRADYDEQKQTALEIIRQHLISGSWAGDGKREIRANFRFKMLEQIRRKVHENSFERAKTGDRFAAVCFSGGGIRSATFGLGVLQGLAKHNLLSKFEYISTVSGGGYIGSWLSAWIHRINNEKNECNPVKEFSSADVKAVEKRLVMQTAEIPEPEEITHLRSYSNYMSPRTGLFSTDTWTLVAVYFRNLLLNWTVFIPLIAAFLLVPRIYETVLGMNPSGSWQLYTLLIALFFGIGAVMNINAMRPSLGKYSWVDQRFKEDDIGIHKSVEGKIFRWVILWILILAFSITTFWAWTDGRFRFPGANWIEAKLQTGYPDLIGYILFSEILFLGGYLLAWTLMLPKYIWIKKQEKLEEYEKEAENRRVEFAKRDWWQTVKYYYSTYLSEALTSLVCGAISGWLLYLVVTKLKFIPDWFESRNLLMEFILCFGVPIFLIVFLLATTLFIGLAVRFTNDEDREWMSRLGALILMFTVGWAVISTAVIFGPYIFTYDWKGGLFGAVGGLSGLITLILGFSSKSSAKVENTEPKSKTSFLMWFAPSIAAPVFVLFLVILISHLTKLLIDYSALFSTFRHVKWFAILAAVGAVMGVFININKFSIHSIYRERLIRAYLGASRTRDRLFSANSFTGLDSERDNVEMRCLRQKPFHVVNMTLNLVKTHNLRWQNRKAESFTATALHSGSSNMGEGSGNYRSSSEYGLNTQNGRALTLGTAAAISGAAASPNMGYFTMSAAVSIIMVLFNVRLGWWLGNPGKRGQYTYNLPAPRWSPRLLLDESIGGTDDSKPYVYLSDGGHFDNLGLYEMVLRRCHLIVVSDAACDEKFEFSDFGGAIHKIRVDMGIPIEFDKNHHPKQKRNCGIGKIRYSCVDGTDAKDGVLIYIKPTLDGDEPIDLKNYKKEHPAFPHESTADQMYSETQFESYRSLGFHQLNSICCLKDECTCQTLANFVTNAESYLTKITDLEEKNKAEIRKEPSEENQ